MGNVTLFRGEKIAFWYDGKTATIASPTDAFYLWRDTVPVTGKKLIAIHDNLALLWATKVAPIIEKVLSGDYIPGNAPAPGSSYWEMSEIPYFGVQVLHENVYRGQYCGTYTIGAAQFAEKFAEMANTQWKLVELTGKRFIFRGTANHDWMIRLF
jgi:hypothetical protein